MGGKLWAIHRPDVEDRDLVLLDRLRSEPRLLAAGVNAQRLVVPREATESPQQAEGSPPQPRHPCVLSCSLEQTLESEEKGCDGLRPLVRSHRSFGVVVETFYRSDLTGEDHLQRRADLGELRTTAGDRR